MKKITILTECIDIPYVSHGEVGMLIQYASDSEFVLQYRNAISSAQLIGNSKNLRQLSSDVALKMLTDEPCFRGIPQLTIFQEAITEELYRLFQLIHLYHFLIENGFTTCEFSSACWWGTELNKLTHHLQSPLKIIFPEARKENKLKKAFNRIASSQFSFDAIYTEMNRIVNRIDPYHRRFLLRKKNDEKKIVKNKSWFYTTAVTYTTIGLLYEPFFSEKFYFLVENKLTGGKPLSKIGRDYISLYQFATSALIPDQNEVRQAAHEIYQHISNVSLNPFESLARTLLMKSEWLRIFFSRFLSHGLFSSAVFNRWINLTEPSLLIVGNPGFEGYALYQARHNKIPTVLLQHGVLGPYYPYTDHPVDHYVVRGKYWHDQLSSNSKKRAVIVNPVTKTVQKNVNSEKKLIMFVTTPLRITKTTLEIDIDSILLTLLQTIDIQSMDFVIRVHPLEKIEDYRNRIEKLQKKIHSQLIIRYSQGDNLDALLSQTTAVLTFSSTIFMDCMRHDVPIISYDWLDCWFKDSVKSYDLFYYAKNLADLKQLLLRAKNGELRKSSSHLNRFLEGFE